MDYVKCDSRGRIYLKDGIREHYGSKFMVVEALDELVFIPVPEDPLKDFGIMGKKLRGKSIDKLKKEIRARAKYDLR